MNDETKKQPAPKRGRPKNETVRVIVPNVWSTKGKHFRGDEVTLPPAEVALMRAKGQVE